MYIYIGEISTGCKQGDYLTSTCFCVGFQSPLKEIDVLIKEAVSLSTIEESTAGVYSYVDDVNIFVRNSLANEISTDLEDTDFLNLHTSKCHYLGIGFHLGSMEFSSLLHNS